MNSEQPRKHPTGFLRQLAVAMELPFILVGGVVISGGLGYFLDLYLHTSPWLMFLLGALGFVAGIREILRRLPRDESSDPNG